MPTADVTVLELADAVKARVEAQVDYVESVEVVDADPDDLDEIRKGLGRHMYGVRIMFEPDAVFRTEPGIGNYVTFEFGLIVTVLLRRLGNASSRVDDSVGNDVTKLAKDVIKALETQSLGILNQGGLHCGPARFVVSGDSLQAMQFTLTARSRESRS